MAGVDASRAVEAELVFVRPRFRGDRRQQEHVMVAGIDADNLGSIAFHRALGFTEVARMPEVGRKFDRWLDLVLMQRILD